MTRFRLGIVEDNHRLREGLKKGLEREGFDVIFTCADATSALEQCIQTEPDVILMDVQLDRSSGIVAAVQIRKEFPRKPVVFYSIQDEDRYFDDFMESGILTHFAYVRKSNYLLPDMVAPLLRDAIGGRSFIDPEIEARLHQVKEKKSSPMDLLEPNEAKVARMLASGMSNEQ
ncbi:MAG: response regulator transcription factor, partial [Leptospiraceae bacterium]|nr:response regulator transcription factor [Leptospiraceae bacterium]